MDFNTTQEIEWSDYLESYFKSLGEKSYGYSYCHKKAEASYASKRNYIDLPVIVLSTVAGTLSIGNTNIFGENEKMASMGIGALSLFVSVMNTIGTYFSFASRSEAHRISHIQYARLFRFLDIELSLPRHERMKPKDLLKVSRDQYERLHEISPLIPDKILKKFKKTFKDYNVSKPSEANGLEEIVIYKEKIKRKKSEDSLVKSDTFEDFLDEETKIENKINTTFNI